jgi:mannose-1-phosphate guanylyltransferase
MAKKLFFLKKVRARLRISKKSCIFARSMYKTGMKNHQNNYCVIMAGGIGSRFWPYSREEKPKQFLDFFGTGRSLLQMTIDRFRPLIPIENVFIVTNKAYKNIILEQVPDLAESQILCEPARRNTAPCIAYATAAIQARVKGQDPKEINIVVAASDHLILEEEKFRQTIQKAFDFVGANKAICTLGMQPTRPETGYGYIQYLPSSSAEGINPVKQFKEKPNLETAKDYLASGDYLWNSGIFIWSLETINEALELHLPQVASIFAQGAAVMGTDQEVAFIEENFPRCPNISIDYAVMEKAHNVFVLPSSFGWSDLGTWGSLYELSEKDEKGNVSLHSKAHFYEAERNIVVLESGKVAIVQGVDDLIIAEQDGALLICKKPEEQRIKNWVAEI